MKFNQFVLSSLLLLLVVNTACKKELQKIKGKYTGTVRYVEVNPRNPASNKDTLYKNVSIEVKEGSESTPQKITVEVIPSVGYVDFNKNIPIDGGMVNYTRTNPNPGYYYRWQGEIKSDSLNLTHRTDNINGSYDAWIYAAKK